MKIQAISFCRKSPIKTAFKEGKVPLEKDLMGGILTSENATLDHALARCKGGKSRLSNYSVMSAANNNLKGDKDIFEFITEENTKQYFKAFEGADLGKYTGEQYLTMFARTLKQLWEESPITKNLEMWEVLKRWQ